MTQFWQRVMETLSQSELISLGERSRDSWRGTPVDPNNPRRRFIDLGDKSYIMQADKVYAMNPELYCDPKICAKHLLPKDDK
eukprot:CAMPEP_0118922074 /NCGR_PEP_ID=MMETSP1169-20130426/1131_1 /TAXON_ID=36882 /ORGANISM="Pyramimonas obovata, Strain CCMP722" /LENGTH=81 /DNA_ID=CAMNT_0006862893 /DNA_START=154 /DNA_END=399 /DNA_ORIENTATION=+